MPFDAGKKPMPEHGREELIAALKKESSWSQTYIQTELEAAQIEATKRYYGDTYGDEVEGRSSVTTREVYETIQWLRPDLRRTFTAGDKVFEFEGTTPQADQHAQAATDLVNHTFLNDNEGERELDAFIFDGLLHRVGIIACEWKGAEYSPAQEATGLNTMQVQQIMADPRVDIVEQDVRQDQPDEAHPDGMFFDLKIRRVTADARPEVFTIAPEDFRIAARSVDLEPARYAADIVRMMRGEAKKKWPDYVEEIDSAAANENATDERRAERFRDVEGWDAGSMGKEGEGEATEVEIMREYIRFDMDGDGIAELIRCYRLNDCLLEYEEVDEHIYSHWTPNPIPHRFYGLGIADEASDLQRVKTVLLRSMLDCVYQSVAPRVYANTKMIGAVGLDALLTVRPGVVIEGEGPANEALFPITTPDMSGPALTGMQWIDRVLESRTGVNRSAQPMDPDLLHDTAKGVELLQNAASVRKEEIARNLAVGLQQFGMKLYRLIHKHQNEARSVKIAGEWRNIDPRAWEAEMCCTVNVGLGTGAREKQLLMMQVLQNDQALAVQTFGPDNPSVGPMELYNMVEEKGRILGHKSIDKWFKLPVMQDPQTGQMVPWKPQPQPSPEQMKIQAQMQEGQARLQLDAAKAQQDIQVKQFEVDAKAGADAQKAQLDAQIKQMEAQATIQLEREKMLMQMQMQREQMQFEMQMKREQFEFEKQLSQQESDAKVAAMKTQADAKGGVSSTKFGGDPG